MEEILIVRVGALCMQSLIRMGSFDDLRRLALLWFYTGEVAVKGPVCHLFSVPSVPPWFIPPMGFTDV